MSKKCKKHAPKFTKNPKKSQEICIFHSKIEYDGVVRVTYECIPEPLHRGVFIENVV